MADSNSDPRLDPPWADLLLQEVPGLPEVWRGLQSVVQPATEPAPAVTWDDMRATMDKIITKTTVTLDPWQRSLLERSFLDAYRANPHPRWIGR